MKTDLKLRGEYWLTTLKRSIRLTPRYEGMLAPTALPSNYFVLHVPITKSCAFQGRICAANCLINFKKNEAVLPGLRMYNQL